MSQSRVARLQHVLVRALTPIGSLNKVAHATVAAVALVSSGTFLGLQVGVTAALAVVFAAFSCLLLHSAWKLQGELDMRIASEPHLTLDAPRKKVADVRGVNGEQTKACFVVVPISNRRPDGATAGSSADDVHASVRVTDLGGKEIAPWQQARWAHTIQQIERGPFAPAHDPLVAEATLPPNGRWLELDTVVQFEGDRHLALWTQSGAHPIDVSGRVKVGLRVQGSNVETETLEFEVTPGSPPSFDPAVVLLAME